MIDISGIGSFLGLDVGKDEHHATAVTPAGKKTFDKRLPNSKPKLREAFGKLQAKHGTVLVVVDQPASIGALPPAVARDGLPGRLPARADDEADRRPLPGRGQDRCPRRVRHRGRGPRHAPHTPLGRPRGGDHRRARDDRRPQRRPGR